MSFGVMGGNMQPQGHLQTLVRMLDYRQQPQAACDAPRWRYNGGIVNNEHGFDPATRKACATSATACSRLPTATRTTAPASSSGAWATLPWKAMLPPATRAATGRPPATDASAAPACAWTCARAGAPTSSCIATVRGGDEGDGTWWC
jgi:gamma-glutamyltranspeptidase